MGYRSRLPPKWPLKRSRHRLLVPQLPLQVLFTKFPQSLTGHCLQFPILCSNLPSAITLDLMPCRSSLEYSKQCQLCSHSAFGSELSKGPKIEHLMAEQWRCPSVPSFGEETHPPSEYVQVRAGPSDNTSFRAMRLASKTGSA